MKDFLYRTVEETTEVYDEDGEKIQVSAWRTRNSNGSRSIGVSFGKQRINFDSGDDYEQHAILLRDLLTKIINHPCNLPSLEQEIGE